MRPLLSEIVSLALNHVNIFLDTLPQISFLYFCFMIIATHADLKGKKFQRL